MRSPPIAVRKARWIWICCALWLVDLVGMRPITLSKSSQAERAPPDRHRVSVSALRLVVTHELLQLSFGLRRSSAASASGRLRETTSWLSRSLRAVLVVRPDTGAADQPPAATRVLPVATQ